MWDDDEDSENEKEVEQVVIIERRPTYEETILMCRELEENWESPIDINLGRMKVIDLPDLMWKYYSITPRKVKMVNTGHTALVMIRFNDETPYISGGPLIGKYVFSQLHFHWGKDDMEGSEHSVDGTKYPCELHVVHYNNLYLSQEIASLEKDGVMVVVYFYKLQQQDNETIQLLLDSFPLIREAHSAARLTDFPLSTFLPEFNGDYFMYWGNIKTARNLHDALWIVCRIPMGISIQQMKIFRTLFNENEEPLLSNYRELETVEKHVYHVNPSPMRYATLLPIPPQNIDQMK